MKFHAMLFAHVCVASHDVRGAADDVPQIECCALAPSIAASRA